MHTLGELKLMGNCLLGSRPLLIFDKRFDETPRWGLMKEILTQVCWLHIVLSKLFFFFHSDPPFWGKKNTDFRHPQRTPKEQTFY